MDEEGKPFPRINNYMIGINCVIMIYRFRTDLWSSCVSRREARASESRPSASVIKQRLGIPCKDRARPASCNAGAPFASSRVSSSEERTPNGGGLSGGDGAGRECEIR